MKTYAGLDLHGDNVYCGIADETDRRLYEKRLPCDIDAIARTLEPYRDTLQSVIVESTFNWYWLVDGLQERNFPVKLANPGGMETYQGLKHGDDRSDAFFLAKMDRLGILPVGYIYPREDRAIRDLCRRRLRCVQLRAMQILSLEGLLARETGHMLNGTAIRALSEADLDAQLPDRYVRQAADVVQKHMEFLDEQISKLEASLLKSIQLRPEFMGLKTVPGIGKILAMTIALETGDICRFASPGHYASYCRTVRSVRTSNNKKKGEGNTKNGNKYLSWAFVEAANFMPRYCPEAKAYFQRKVGRTGIRAVAVKSLAAKLSKACFFIMRDGVDFDVKKIFQ